MPKITRLGGATNAAEETQPTPPPRTIADHFRALGKLSTPEQDEPAPPPSSEPEATGSDQQAGARDTQPAGLPNVPSITAPKSEWVDYVVARTGLSRTSVQARTRVQLIKAWGEG